MSHSTDFRTFLMENDCFSVFPTWGKISEWAETLPSGITTAEAWELCQNPEWMFNMLQRAGLDDDRKLASHNYRFVHEFQIEDGKTNWDVMDEKERHAIEVLGMYAEKKATPKELFVATSAAMADGGSLDFRIPSDRQEEAVTFQANLMREVFGNPFKS